MADAKRVVIPGLRFTGEGVPTPPVDALADSLGAFIYLDLSHPANPVTGIPTDLPNLVAKNAERLMGTGTSAGLTVSNTFGAGGKVERTAKGGLHLLPSKTTDVTGQVFQVLMTPSMASYVLANQSDYWFLSMSVRMTRAGAAGIPTQIARLAQNSNTVLVDISEGSSGTSVLGQPTPNRTTSVSPGLAHISVAAQGGSLASILQWFISAGPVSASLLHKTPSFIVYNLYIESLSKSGRSYATARSIAESIHSSQHGTGRWAGDTYSTPSVLSP